MQFGGPCCSPDASNSERKSAITEAFEIEYSRFRSISDELALIVQRNIPEGEYRAIISSSRNGRTRLAKSLLKRFPINYNILGDAAIVPVVYIKVPVVSSIGEFAMRVLRKLGQSFNDRSSTTSLLSAAFSSCAAMETRAIIVDDFQRLHVGMHRAREGIFNIIRDLGEESKISVFAFGDPTATQIISNVSQLSGVFEYRTLDRWKYDEEFMRLILTIESRLPLREVSNIVDNHDLMTEILSVTDGVLGHIVKLVHDCAFVAMDTGRERIDMQTFEQRSWLPPVGRQQDTLNRIEARPHELIPPHN